MTASEERARQLVADCAERGVAEFVVCAGSRNSPMVLELLRCGARTWSFFEERAAGFFALGRCRALDAPVGIVTTSGTAAAELLPAVIEAHYLRAPLLAITADRPKEYRGTGAPQAIEQVGLFGEYVGASWDDAWDLATWDGFGPAHVNVCFGEPLVSAGNEVRSSSFRRAESVRNETARQKAERRTALPCESLLVLLGEIHEADRPQVRDFLAQLGAPILADATSGLREAFPHLMLQSGERVLRGFPPKTVLRIGGVPSGRFWRDLENLPDVEVISVLHRGFSGLARNSIQTDLASLERTGVANSSVLARDCELTAQFAKLLARFPNSEPALFAALSQTIPPNATVFLGNSLPIREWNLAATYDPRGYQIWANRGANGIDGNLSTFLGLAAESPESWAVVGDLTALYDLAAPWILRDLPPGKRRVVIVNNGGGRIFSRLPVLKDLDPASRRVTENVHNLNFAAWAAMWGLGYERLTTAEIPAGLPDHAVLELVPDAAETDAFWAAFEALHAL